MNSREPKIILERFYSRNVLGYTMVVIIIGFFYFITEMPRYSVAISWVFGFLLAFLLSTFFYLTPERTNIILTVDEIRFREGVWFNRKPMAITWDNICEVNYKKIKLGKCNGVEQECFELHLKKKGTHKEDKPHQIEYSSGPKAKLGRRVKYSSKNINANDAVQLIRSLIDAKSNEARTNIVIKNMGVPDKSKRLHWMQNEP